MLEVDVASKTIRGLFQSPVDLSSFGNGLISLPVQSKFKIKSDSSNFYCALPTKLHDCINCGFVGNLECCKLFECNIKNNNGIKYRKLPKQFVKLDFESFKELIEQTDDRGQLLLLQNIWFSCFEDQTAEQNEIIKNTLSIQFERLNYDREC